MVTHDLFRGQQPPPLDTRMGQHYHTYLYIKNILEGAEVAPPDKSSFNGSFSTVSTLYDAYSLGGQSAAIAIWHMLKSQDNQLRHYEEPMPMLINCTELKYLPSPKYLLDAYPIYSRGLSILVGASGAGKSFVALDLAARLSATQKVIYVATEGLYGFNARWQSWKAYNKPDYHPEFYFYIEELQVLNPDDLNMFINSNRDDKPALVIIDTLARSAVGLEENSARDMGLYIAATGRIQKELECAVLIVHHTNKEGTMRGSNSLYGAADSVMFLKREGDLITLHNDHGNGGKNKYAKELPAKYYHLEPYDVEYENKWGEMVEVSGAILRESDQNMTRKVLSNKLTTQQKAILTAIKDSEGAIKPPEIQKVTNIPKQTIYRLLSQLKETAFVGVKEGAYNLTESGMKILS